MKIILFLNKFRIETFLDNLIDKIEWIFHLIFKILYSELKLKLKTIAKESINFKFTIQILLKIQNDYKELSKIT